MWGMWKAKIFGGQMDMPPRKLSWTVGAEWKKRDHQQSKNNLLIDGRGWQKSIQVWEGAWMWFECDNCGKEVWTNHKLRNHHGNAHNSFSDNCWHTLTLCELTFVVKLSGPHLQKMKRVVKWIRWKSTKLKCVSNIIKSVVSHIRGSLKLQNLWQGLCSWEEAERPRYRLPGGRLGTS